MAWLGIIIGLLVGAGFESFQAAMFLGALGGFVGYVLGSKGRAQGSAQLSALEAKVETLSKQLQRMTQRITALEAHLNKPASESAAQASTQSAPATSAAVQPEDKPAKPVSAPAPETAPAPMPLKMPTEAARQTQAVSIPVTDTPPSQTAAASATAAAPQRKEETRAARPAPPPSPPAPPREPTWLSTFVHRWVIGGNPLVKIGVLILFLGLAFLLRYVAEHTVVPIELRYAGVAAAGIGLLLFGWRVRRKADNYGVILQGAGIGVLYLTTLAAMKLHPLIPPAFGFAVLFAVAAFAALLAILQDALPLAIAASLGGFAAPVLASTGSEHHVAFFSYLALINLGIVTIAWFKTWRALNVIGFVCTFLLAAAWGDKYYRPELFGIGEPFLLLLFVTYVLITFLFARRTLAQAPAGEASGLEQRMRQAVPLVSYVDGTLVFGVPLASFGLQYMMTKPFEYGAAFSALGFGLAYLALAFLLFRKTGLRYALLSETMIALGLIFGSLAIPLGLEQKWTSAAWAVEAAGVYWIGVRQQRVHARLFALLLLFGSAVYFALGIHDGDLTALDGSPLGCFMLAAAVWCVYGLLRGAAERLHAFERAVRGWLIGFGCLFVALLPLLIWNTEWASTAMAILGTVAVYASQRLRERALTGWGCFYQALAGLLFIATLRGAASGSVLSNGWTGLLMAALIGGAMLVGVWTMARNIAQNSERRENTPSSMPVTLTLVLLGGFIFVNLAPLFVLHWRYAAMVWPLTGIAILWWALQMRHLAALAFGLILQGIAGIAYFGSRLLIGPGTSAAEHASALKPFLHSGFFGPLLIALAAFVCARLLQRKSASYNDAALGGITLFWAGAWWAFAWADEIRRVAPADLIVPSLIGIAVVSAWLWSAIAQPRDWAQLGSATLAYVPVLLLLLAASMANESAHPLAGWGAAAWPAALAMHLLLLRRQHAWVQPSLLAWAHTVGVWLFILVAAIELRWQFAHWTDAGSAWPLLGWMIAPVAWLWAMIVPALRSRWPLKDYRDAYVLVSALPIAIYLLFWVWITNAVSDGAAAPLPYVPLLNPLEIAQAAVLLGIALWWSSLREHDALRSTGALFAGLLGASGLAVVTGVVLRTCHHWGGVAWQADALTASTLVQASLSIVWSIVAIALMLLGNRRGRRSVWIAGAALMGVVVAKLFLIELAAKGSLARIVSFIVVGLLLLVVGYFAPLPPKRAANAADTPARDATESTTA
jgi:uncharacterized membrane protein